MADTVSFLGVGHPPHCTTRSNVGKRRSNVFSLTKVLFFGYGRSVAVSLKKFNSQLFNSGTWFLFINDLYANFVNGVLMFFLPRHCIPFRTSLLFIKEGELLAADRRAGRLTNKPHGLLEVSCFSAAVSEFNFFSHATFDHRCMNMPMCMCMMMCLSALLRMA